MKKNILILFIYTMISQVIGNCPKEKKLSFGPCAFHVECSRKIAGVFLPTNCRGSQNYPVSIDLILTDIDNHFNQSEFDINFLTIITSLKMQSLQNNGSNIENNLAILQYMPRLQNLSLVHNRIESLQGSPFNHLDRLKLLDLSHNNLSNIENLFQFDMHPNMLTTLSLSYNKIEAISKNSFAHLTALVELDLSHNMIADLIEDPFNNLGLLQTLKLNDNKIKNLNGALNNLHNLKHLYLFNNKIDNTNAESIKIIYDLETFDVSNNQLTTVKTELLSRHWYHFGSNSMCKIVLSKNFIVNLQNATDEDYYVRFTRSTRGKIFNSADVLTDLNLSNNVISDIEYNAFHSLIRLVYLDISNNKIVTFSVNPEDMIHVKYLNLSNNYISQLEYNTFWLMDNLQYLDLSGNYLNFIPDKVFTYTHQLKYVNMTENNINRIENLKNRMFHPKGGVLDLSSNNITYLNINRDGLHLTLMVLKYNNINNASLININNNNEVDSMDMSHNNINYLDKTSLNLPDSLSTLDLSENQIEKIGPGSFYCVTALQTLRLRHNRINSIDYGIFHGLVKLLYLDLSYNSITFLDAKVMADLKSLKILLIKYNGLQVLDYKAWLRHKFDLRVFLDGNRFPCTWLSEALSDFNNGFSKMKPVTSTPSVSDRSIEGISCVHDEVGQLMNPNESVGVLANERLLVMVQKILEAVKEQNNHIKKYMWNSTNIH